MGKVNWGRVFLCGLLAALVLGVLGGISWYLFWGEAMLTAVLAVNRTFQVTPALLVTWILVHLLTGCAIMWVYASIRPRYGPGPKTAAIAGIAVWFIAVLADVGWTSLGIAPIGLVTVILAGFLVFFVVAAVVGAWPYKE